MAHGQSPGNSLARRGVEQPVTHGVPAPAAVELPPGVCSGALSAPSSVMGMTGCLLTCRELMEFTIHYRYIALGKKGKNLYSTVLTKSEHAVVQAPVNYLPSHNIYLFVSLPEIDPPAPYILIISNLKNALAPLV